MVVPGRDRGLVCVLVSSWCVMPVCVDVPLYLLACDVWFRAGWCVRGRVLVCPVLWLLVCMQFSVFVCVCLCFMDEVAHGVGVRVMACVLVSVDMLMSVCSWLFVSLVGRVCVWVCDVLRKRVCLCVCLLIVSWLCGGLCVCELARVCIWCDCLPGLVLCFVFVVLYLCVCQLMCV